MSPRKQRPHEPEESPDRYGDLAAALIATPEFKAALTSITSIDQLTGKGGLIAGMLKPLINELLQAEMTEYVGYEKHDVTGYGSGNSRNGSYSRTLRSSDGLFAAGHSKR